MYTLSLPDQPLSVSLLDEMRAWLRAHLSAVSLDSRDVWYLFSDMALRDSCSRQLQSDPSAVFYGYATIWLRPVYIGMETVRDPETDRHLHAFVTWALTRAPLVLEDGGMVIPVDDLVHPELYE